MCDLSIIILFYQKKQKLAIYKKEEKSCSLSRNLKRIGVKMTPKSIGKEAIKLIEEIGPHLDKGCDVSYAIIPEGRRDCCVARRSVENLRSGGGYDTIYFFWKTDGKLQYKELFNSKSTQDYVHIDSARVENGKAIIIIHSGGTHKASPWKQTFEIDLVEIGLKA